MKYIVVNKFFDKLDETKHIYNVGDFFPRKDIEVDNKRLKELSTNKNTLKRILIKKIDIQSDEDNETVIDLNTESDVIASGSIIKNDENSGIEDEVLNIDTEDSVNPLEIKTDLAGVVDNEPNKEIKKAVKNGKGKTK